MPRERGITGNAERRASWRHAVRLCVSWLLVGLAGTAGAPAASGQSPWTVALTPTMNPLPIGSCAEVWLDLKDPATRDVPRNPQGRRVSIADFDMNVATASAGEVASNNDGPSIWRVCGCQGAAIGNTATVTADYPAKALPPKSRVPGVAFRAAATFTLAKARGASDPAACVAAKSQPLAATVSQPMGQGTTVLPAGAPNARASAGNAATAATGAAVSAPSVTAGSTTAGATSSAAAAGGAAGSGGAAGAGAAAGAAGAAGGGSAGAGTAASTGGASVGAAAAGASGGGAAGAAGSGAGGGAAQITTQTSTQGTSAAGAAGAAGATGGGGAAGAAGAAQATTTQGTSAGGAAGAAGAASAAGAAGAAGGGAAQGAAGTTSTSTTTSTRGTAPGTLVGAPKTTVPTSTSPGP